MGREQIGDIREYHLREMESKLQEAKEYSSEGNESRMLYKLKEAREHAENADALVDGRFEERASKIRNDLGSIKGYHVREFDYHIRRAREWAQEGDERGMSFHLGQASSHDKKAKKCNEEDEKKVEFDPVLQSNIIELS